LARFSACFGMGEYTHTRTYSLIVEIWRAYHKKKFNASRFWKHIPKNATTPKHDWPGNSAQTAHSHISCKQQLHTTNQNHQGKAVCSRR
jgi:hypothetical protein